MNTDNRRILKYFLLARESDIALDIEDFGQLRPIFKEAIGREPNRK